VHSTTLPIFRKRGGVRGNRTHDPLLAKQVLSQLSYNPTVKMVLIVGFELTTY
jgi:hypothetical protein